MKKQSKGLEKLEVK